MKELDELAVALQNAADVLQRSGNPYHRAWSAHFRADRNGLLLLLAAWREPNDVISGDHRQLVEKASRRWRS